MGIAYVTGERSIFGELVLGMVLGTLFGMALGKTQGAEVGARGIGVPKVEFSCVGYIMIVNPFCVCFAGIGYGSLLVD